MINYFIIIIISLQIACSYELNTIWGRCNLYRENASINEDQLINIINNKIKKLNNLFGPIKNEPFDFYIYNKDNLYDLNVNTPQWKWSLGITYRNNKIIIKDPKYSHITVNKFKQVVEHELNHLMINRIDLNRTIPRWFKEGFAMLTAHEISMKHKIKVIRSLGANNLYNLDDLFIFSNFTHEEYMLAYAQSALYVEALQNIYGEDLFINIIENLKNNVNFNDAMYHVTLNEMYQIEENIKDYIQQKYRWLKLINFSDLLFSIMPLLLVIGFIVKSYKVRAIKKQWEIEEELEDLMSQ